MLIYLASPYSPRFAEVRNQRYQEAVKAAAVLAKQGVPCYCPVAFWHNVALSQALPTTADFWWAQNKKMMDVCTQAWVLTLPDWERSAGLAEEIAYLRSIKQTVIYCSIDNLPALAEGRLY